MAGARTRTSHGLRRREVGLGRWAAQQDAAASPHDAAERVSMAGHAVCPLSSTSLASTHFGVAWVGGHFLLLHFLYFVHFAHAPFFPCPAFWLPCGPQIGDARRDRIRGAERRSKAFQAKGDLFGRHGGTRPRAQQRRARCRGLWLFSSWHGHPAGFKPALLDLRCRRCRSGVHTCCRRAWWQQERQVTPRLFRHGQRRTRDMRPDCPSCCVVAHRSPPASLRQRLGLVRAQSAAGVGMGRRSGIACPVSPWGAAGSRAGAVLAALVAVVVVSACICALSWNLRRMAWDRRKLASPVLTLLRALLGCRACPHSARSLAGCSSRSVPVSWRGILQLCGLRNAGRTVLERGLGRALERRAVVEEQSRVEQSRAGRRSMAYDCSRPELRVGGPRLRLRLRFSFRLRYGRFIVENKHNHLLVEE